MDSNYKDTLKYKKNEIEQKIAKFQKILEGINYLLTEEQSTGEQLSDNIVSQNTLFGNNKKESIIVAVKRFFDSNQYTLFSSKDIGNEIDKLIGMKIIKVRAKTPMKSAYAVLRKLNQQGFLEKFPSEDSNEVMYKKNLNYKLKK